MQVHSRVKKRATLHSALASSHCPLLHFIQEGQRNIRTKKLISTVWATKHFRDTQNTLNTVDHSYLSPFHITALSSDRTRFQHSDVLADSCVRKYPSYCAQTTSWKEELKCSALASGPCLLLYIDNVSTCCRQVNQRINLKCCYWGPKYAFSVCFSK